MRVTNLYWISSQFYNEIIFSVCCNMNKVKLFKGECWFQWKFLWKSSSQMTIQVYNSGFICCTPHISKCQVSAISCSYIGFHTVSSCPFPVKNHTIISLGRTQTDGHILVTNLSCHMNVFTSQKRTGQHYARDFIPQLGNFRHLQ